MRADDHLGPEHFPRNGLVCSVCGQWQVVSPGGETCPNGHGGAEGVTPRRRKRVTTDPRGSVAQRERAIATLYALYPLLKEAETVLRAFDHAPIAGVSDEERRADLEVWDALYVLVRALDTNSRTFATMKRPREDLDARLFALVKDLEREALDRALKTFNR